MTDYCPQEKEGSGAMSHLQSQSSLLSLGHSFEKAHNFNGSLSQLSCLWALKILKSRKGEMGIGILLGIESTKIKSNYLI